MKQYRFGVSVFTGLVDYSLEESLKYLELAHQKGAELVFSSAHINEAKKANEELQQLINKVASLGMQISLDVSKKAYEGLNDLTNLTALRLDYGFTDQEIIDMSNQAPFLVELNASTISVNELITLINKGLNTKRIRLSFNYYPKLYTAHDIESCLPIIQLCHEYQIPICGFLPSKVGKRPPLYEGLPSIELHRNMELSQAVEEMKAAGFDEIIFGDAYASIDEINTLKLHQDTPIEVNVNLVDNLPEDIIPHLMGTFKIRPDLNSYMIRMTSKRGNIDFIPFNTVERKKGAITIDNLLFNRYKGEICLVLKDLPLDERVNVIGYTDTTSFILSQIKKGLPFCFKINN